MTPAARASVAASGPVERFFQAIAERGHEPGLRKVDGAIRFDLTHRGKRERWLVEMRRGDVTVSRRNSAAGCVVRGDKRVLARIVSGRANALTSVLRGEMSLDGDLELLLLFQRLFPGPPGARGPQRSAVVSVDGR